MRAIVLEYHDVVTGSDFNASGYAGEAANSYKIADIDFASHLQVVLEQGGVVCNDVRTQAVAERDRCPVLFTFDDGGSGSLVAAQMLEAQGWRGHFFVTTDRIGTAGFLAADDIRSLHHRGHVIGSHSHSHPVRMARLTPTQVEQEWTHSIDALQCIVGSPVQVASVPGGYYGEFVGLAAAAAGIRWLFTSEPQLTVGRVASSAVYGRYTIRRLTGRSSVRSLLVHPSFARASQWTTWNLKKVAKALAGDAYLRVRSSLFGDA